jgi:DNA polymerase I-like protein with 3'-5' exonuclease and polymerase domains
LTKPPDQIDTYAAIAALIFKVPVEMVTPEQRSRGKTIAFASIYGQVFPRILHRRESDA